MGVRCETHLHFFISLARLLQYISQTHKIMKYEIGEYWLTREKVPFLDDVPIHYLGYVDGSASGIIYDTYEDAMDEIKKKMRADEESGRMKEDDIIIYFTAGWEDRSCQLWMHISGNYDEDTLALVHEYDDRIFVESLA